VAVGVARADVDVAGFRDHQRAVDSGDAFQKAQGLHVSVNGKQDEEMAALAAGGAVEGAIGSDGEGAHGTFVRRDDIHGRIAQVAQVDAHLADHRVVVIESALRSKWSAQEHSGEE
jgi:hypothetical protein